MLVGVGFEERNDAFDFYTCLTDFRASVASVSAPAQPQHQLMDLKLKEGDKISIKLNTPAVVPSEEPLISTSGPVGLPPPPKGQSTRVRRQGGPGGGAKQGDDEYDLLFK